MKVSFMSTTCTLCCLLLIACTTIPATRTSVDKAYTAGNDRYLARVAAGAIPADDSGTRAYATKLRRDLGRREIVEAIKAAKERKSVPALERILANADNPFLEADLVASARAAILEIQRDELLSGIEDAKIREDVGYLQKVIADQINPLITADLRRRAEGYLKTVQAAMAERERARALKEWNTRLDLAFMTGDDSVLRSVAVSSRDKVSAIPDDIELRRKASTYLAVQENPAKAVLAQRTGKIDPRVRRIPAALSGSIRNSPEQSLDPLVQFLVQGIYDPFERAKVIHDWIADNVRYNIQGLLSGNLGDNSWPAVLRTGTSVCAGYARLFEEMCSRAGIACTVVSGYAKGFGYDPLVVQDRDNNHDWNIVTILGTKYLVDVTWDSGHINERNQDVKEYSTEYLFQSPSAFSYTHFPENPKNQLLDAPLSMDAFLDLPKARGRFFDLGLSVVPGTLHAVMKGNNRLTLPLICPATIRLDAELRDNRGHSYGESCMVTRDGDTVQILIAFPGEGNFQLDLFGTSAGSGSGTMESLMDLALVNIGVGCEQPAYPMFYSPYFDRSCRLREPLQGILEGGKEYRFSIEVPGATRIGYKDGRDFKDLQMQGPGQFSAIVRVPTSGYFELYLPTGGSSWSGICRFAVH